MKYAILMSLVGAVALVSGCSDDPKTGETGGNGGNGGSESSSSSSSSSSGMGGAGGGTSSSSSSSSSTSTSTSSSSSTSTSTSSSSSGVPLVCDNPAVVDKVDSNMRCKNALPGEVVDIVMAPATMVWADKIEDFSTEYGIGNYGSTQAKGAPDVYPASGDEPKAWAQSAADSMTPEFIKVGYTVPVMAESVWVFETYNPGAISKITITAGGVDSIVYEKMNPQSVGACSHVLSVSTKTCTPISAVRIDIASDKVLGFNEIDAVGLLPPK